MADSRNNTRYRRRQAELEAALNDQHQLRQVRAMAETLHRQTMELIKEVKEMKAAYDKLSLGVCKSMTFLFQLLDDPDARQHAQQVFEAQAWDAARGGLKPEER